MAEAIRNPFEGLYQAVAYVLRNGESQKAAMERLQKEEEGIWGKDYSMNIHDGVITIMRQK